MISCLITGMIITYLLVVSKKTCITIECLFQTTYHLKLLQEALMPVSALDLGGSFQTILGLQKKWNEMKPQFQVKKQIGGFG